MSEVAQEPDVGLAPGGTWSPPAAPPAVPMPTVPPPGRAPGAPARTMSSGLTSATAVALLSSAVICVIAGWLRFNEAASFQRWRTSGFDDVDASRALSTAENASYAAYLIAFWGCIAVFVLMVVWTYHARVVIERFGPTQLRWSAGWAVGAWFIPLANAVIPKQVVNEIERVSSPDAGPYPVLQRWQAAKLRLVGWIWWLCLLAGTLIVVVALSSADSGYPSSADFDSDGYRRSLQLYGVGMFVIAVSGIAGAIMIRRLGTQLNRSLTVSTGTADDDRAFLRAVGA